MKRILFIATMAVAVLSCSREDNNPSSQQTNPISSGKKLKQISSDNVYNTYQWKEDKLVRIEYYKDGFLQNYTKISYENNLRKIDSAFDVRNAFLGRTTYTYNSNDFLILEERHKVGYFYEKRMEALRRLNQGYINREEYLKEIDKLKKSYTPHIKSLIAKIPYSVGSSMYNDAVYEIEKNNDAPHTEYKYAYGENGYISKVLVTVDGNKGTTREYTYFDNRKRLHIKYISPLSGDYYKVSLTFDGKKGLLSDISPNKKADFFYNTTEWKVLEYNMKTPNTMRDNTSVYTYDRDGYPLTEVRTYSDGSILNRTFTWE